MRLLVVSGRSGSGKSSALHLLEDEGFTCIDNIPVTLLPALVEQILSTASQQQSDFAIGIDARNINSNLNQLVDFINSGSIPRANIQVIFLDSSTEVLLKRFSETRRRHPLSDETTGLHEAIAEESEILAPVAKIADYTLDTTQLSLHELRSAVKRLIVGEQSKGMAIMFKSFGFKYGIPIDMDFVFDVRCLPNPFWNQALREQTGLDNGVKDFLASEQDVNDMFNDICDFLQKWIPKFEQNNRSYLTVAIGCTGGRHRSVYMCERLAKALKNDYKNVQARHRQLGTH